MCAIFGSFNREMFEILHNANVQRGSWSGSITGINEPNNKMPYVVNRWPGSAKIEEKTQKTKHSIYLGHLQAPTSVERNVCEENIHPFEYNNYLVAHNGVLTNFNELIDEFNFNDHYSKVDSSIIPRLIDHYSKSTDEVDAIIKTFSRLNGTFSTWCINKQTKDIYLCRLSSTLFYNSCMFTSVLYNITELELPEMTVLKLDINNNTIYPVGKFTGNSHFFRL